MSALLKSPITSRMKINAIDLSDRHPDTDFKSLVLDALEPVLDSIVVLGADVLVATYVKPRRTKGNIILTDKAVEEDRWQGKVGLVLKLGEIAFKYDGSARYEGTVPKLGDYVAFHTSDTREIGLCGYSVRTIPDSLVRMIIPDPELIY